MTKLWIKFGWVMLLQFYAFRMPAQENLSKQSEQVQYYIDLKAGNGNIHKIMDGIAHIKYFDEYGEQDYLMMSIYNWKHENVHNYHLEKSYGLNYYAIEMDWLQKGSTYFLKVIDEKGKQYQITFNGTIELELSPPKAEIVVSPMLLNCEVPTENLVEFYATISGGRPPYDVQWFVLNEDKSTLLYNPHKERIMDQGNGAVVIVDKPPAYHVLLQVTDICGYETKKIVSIGCKGKRDVHHSIFIEPLSAPNTMNRNN